MKNKILKSQKELRTIKIEKNRIYVKARFGPSKITKIPFHINEELAFFIATIIGDGHLKKSKKQITIELTDKYILEEIKRICLQTFEREFNICDIKKRKDRKQSYNINMDSKAIHNLLNQVYGIQIGKKSHIVHNHRFLISDFSLYPLCFLLLLKRKLTYHLIPVLRKYYIVKLSI